MTKGLPVPFIEAIPEALGAAPDPAMVSLAGKMDSLLLEAVGSVIDLRRLNRPDECPSAHLPELAAELAASILPLDNDRTRRKKITGAVRTHKNRGTWEYDAKIMVDSIALGDSVFYSSWATTAAWFLRGGETTEPATYMASLGVDGIDPLLGIGLLGDFTEWEIPGNVYIDVDNAGLTAEQVAQLVLDLASDVVPAYVRVFLGYTVAGAFSVYAGGIIN